MGVDLIGHGGASFNWACWRACLDIAIVFGWQPAGTIAPPDHDREWSGSYCSNDLQEVTKDDARALGLALHRAVAALRNGENLTEEQAKAVDGMLVSRLCELADYAISGRFCIL